MPSARIVDAVLTGCKGWVFVYCTLLFVWVAGLACFAVPSADDFHYGDLGKRLGVWGAVAYEYNNWNGRFFATSLMTGFLGNRFLFLDAYYLCPFFLISLHIIAAYFFLRRWQLFSTGFYFLFTTLLLSSYYLSETLYWASGGFTYGTSAALLLIVAGEAFAVFWALPDTRRRISIGLLCIVVAGCNETAMMAQIVLLSLLGAYALVLHNRTAARTIGFFLLFAIIGGILVAFAPGNTARAAVLPHRDIGKAIAQVWPFIYGRYTSYLIFLVAIMFGAMALFLRSKTLHIQRSILCVFASVLVITILCAVFTRYYCASYNPGRSFAVDYALISILGIVLAQLLHSFIPAKWLAMPWYSIFAALLVCAFLPFRPVEGFSIPTIVTQLENARKLHNYMSERFFVVSSAPKGGQVLLQDYPGKYYNKTFFNDISANFNDWKNKAFCEYFELSKAMLIVSH